ncbi:MAG: hypothetical protein ABIC04_07790 [Nanoarchaeota archaeon]
MYRELSLLLLQADFNPDSKVYAEDKKLTQNGLKILIGLDLL